MAGMKGGGIATWQRALAGLQKLQTKVLDAMSADIEKDMQRNYVAGKDPYGTPWKARKKVYPWPIMRRSGKLYRSLEVSVKGSGLTIKRGNGAPYVSFHQSGTKRLPQRLTVPIHARGIPLSWRKFFTQRVSKEYKALF